MEPRSSTGLESMRGVAPPIGRRTRAFTGASVELPHSRMPASSTHTRSTSPSGSGVSDAAARRVCSRQAVAATVPLLRSHRAWIGLVASEPQSIAAATGS